MMNSPPRVSHPARFSCLLLGLLVSCLGPDSVAQAKADSKVKAKSEKQDKPAKQGKQDKKDKQGKKKKPDKAERKIKDEDIDIRYRTPAESLATMKLPKGYRLELVASEPMVQEPCLCVWDGDGRMYVAELRTYMQDADGSGKFEATSRVVRLEDTDNDGKMDRRTIFADGLILPRVVLPLGNKVIIGETNTLDLYAYEDTDGDGKSDRKELWIAGGKRGGNLEHQPSGLIWAVDNWIYRTYGTYRVRVKNGKVIKEDCPGGGQWGLTQTDEGKVIFVDAGGESGPQFFNTPTVYGKNGNEVGKDWRIVWPRDNVPDVQGGLRRIRDDNTLNHFTATCGQSVYRARRLPADFLGNLIFCEPVGRLIRRGRFEEKQGVSSLHNVYEKDEFITSTDANFRPINSATGPDGGLFIVDMYRGIIQEGNWVKPGSYLRKVVDRLGLAGNFMRGRIWRVVHEDFARDTTQPRMLGKPAGELVRHLSHPNGWWRDTAQKLIILSGDKSVVEALKRLARQGAEPLGRMHALWTLEGLGVLDRELLIEKFADESVIVQRAALRVAEELLIKGDADLQKRVLALVDSKDPQLLKQLTLSIYRGIATDPEPGLTLLKEKHAKIKGIHDLANRLLKAHRKKLADIARKQALAEKEKRELASFEVGEKLFSTLCIACHGKDGKGVLAGTVKMAPAFLKSVRLKYLDRDLLVKAVLHGVTGPLSGRTYLGIMVPMKTFTDKELAGVLNYIRNSFGNTIKDYYDEKTIAKARVETKDRETSYTDQGLMREAKAYHRILKALPAETPGTIPEDRASKKLLVFSDSRGRHQSPVSEGIPMLAAMSDKSKAFEVVLSNTTEDFTAENLAKYQAVFLNNTSGIEKALDSKARKALIEFVANGGGLVAIHGAADGGWSEYTKMLGARADGTPWPARGRWKIRVEDGKHPLMTSFGGKDFKIKDELYRFKSYDRSKIRVLMSIDIVASPKKNKHRKDGDHALAWIRDYGKGRVFYSALGHNRSTMRNTAVLGHWLAGIQYALGNLEADATSLALPPARKAP